MYTRGEFVTNNINYGTLINHTKTYTEIVLINSGTIISAYKTDPTGSYSFNNIRAKELYQLLQNGLKSCTSKNCTPVPFELGAKNQHEFIKSKVEYILQLYRGELVGAYIQSDKQRVELQYMDHIDMNFDIQYVKLTEFNKKFDVSDDELDSVPVRSVQEIALEKEDVSWLKTKKYYIVNDDEVAEKIFEFLDNYNGIISYDTETTGLRINCFSKVNSSYEKSLIKYNQEHPDDQIRADRLVGIIFCVENDISYYFPCYNRKFKNLYQDVNSPIRTKIINNIKARYTVGELRDLQSDMADYVRNTPAKDFRLDVILMERVRNILEKKHIVVHGSFDWKVGWVYEIDTNIKDNTLVMHQIMYKFRSTTSNKGEPSNLKYLTKVEFGVEQWDLNDFFPTFKEDSSGTVRIQKGKKKKNSAIDFSYMDYEGSRVYAPADGDFTFQLCNKYKADMKKNHAELEYLYNVEVVVSCAIAYMEFYGHRIDESKIMNAQHSTKANIVLLESQIRQIINYSDEKELEVYNKLKYIKDKITELENSKETELVEQRKQLENQLPQVADELKEAITNNTEKVINLASPAQVADLFFNKLQIPFDGDKPSVAKKVIKGLLKEKDENGNLKYPVVKLYSDYKNEDTLMSKFFGALPQFMYPGGYIFSSYGQISTATGRMSCSKPNAQQYPKVITKIVAPRDGYVMIDADYSQIEYRVLTALAGNDWLAKLFSDPDSDYHTLMASIMYGIPYASVTPKMRSDSKSLNFGIPYGMGYGSLAILLFGVNNSKTREEAKEKYDLYFENQPKTRKFFDNIKEMAQVHKYTKTQFNRYRYYSFEDKDGNTDNARKAAALRQAGNAVIQGSAADIFKIGVARNFYFIRKNKLFGKFLIVNMVHDEQLMEVDTRTLNVQKILAEIGKNMQFKLENYPPLYIGAGVSDAWGKAKGKMAEIHPLLLDQLTKEAENMPIFKDEKSTATPKEIIKYFDNRVYEFRRKKVVDYLLNPENWHKDLHPAIGGLINLQFNYGRGDEAKAYKGPNGETYTDSEFLMLNLSDFIKENNLNVETAWFKATDLKSSDDEEDKEYTDEDDLDDLLDESGIKREFELVDESDKTFGASLHDMISVFKVCKLEVQGVLGIDTRDMYYKTRDEIIDYLAKYVVNSEDHSNALEIVFLTSANILKHTDTFVTKDINITPIEKQFRKFRKK